MGYLLFLLREELAKESLISAAVASELERDLSVT